MSDIQPKKLAKNEKLKVEDANISDDRIPRNLILMYGETPYIQKAGLEWKANQLFGGAGFSVDLEPVTMDYEKSIFVFKATVTVMKNNQKFVNFGEATAKNANSRMLGQLLHLAATRAECRALRMATACGYASYDEVMTMPDKNGSIAATSSQGLSPEDASKPATPAQRSLLNIPDDQELTFGEAVEKIRDLTKKEEK